MHMTTKILAIGLLIGLGLGATTAQATGGDSCKPKHGGGYTCDVGGTSYNVNNATSEANALAAAIQFQQQQQSQNQSQVSTNTNTATGGNASIEIGDTFIAPPINGGDAHWCYSLPTGGMCVPLKSVMIQNRVNLVDQCFAKTGRAYVACIAMIDDLPQIKRALKQAGVYGN